MVVVGTATARGAIVVVVGAIVVGGAVGAGATVVVAAGAAVVDVVVSGGSVVDVDVVVGTAVFTVTGGDAAEVAPAPHAPRAASRTTEEMMRLTIRSSASRSGG